MSHPATVSEWLRVLETRHPVSIDLGLDRIREVWERLGCPRPARKVITVAGTNGKGSTVAYAATMLLALGFPSGTYTSPHLLRYNERVRIGDAEVTDAELLQAFAQVEAARGATSLTYFEFGTLAAFVLLGRARLDFALLEVGLGGRLDAVNLIDTDCAVITPIGLDHQEYLGPDRESIGREKAGILRRGRPLVCGESEPPRSVLETAGRLSAPVRRLDHDFWIAEREGGLHWRGPEGSVDLPRPPMPGAHQSANLATAIAAVAALAPEALRRPDALAAAIGTVRVPGRLQAVRDHPLVLLDVGHNPLAAQAVASALRELGIRPAICVLGMLRDKDAGAVVAALDASVDLWYCAGLAGERGRSAEDLAREVAAVSGAGRVRAFPEVGSGLRAALQAVSADQSILVFGSFRTAAQAAACLAGEPDPAS
jgi:dihydrofolate synthase/folylpolyglutamate synthase